METRASRKGLVTILKAEVFYTAEGKMVSHYTEPQELLVTNDKKGDITIYNYKENSIIQKQNFLFNTDQNQLFFFLENNKGTLGLDKMGFTLTETTFEDGLKITKWLPPMGIAKEISKAELAHEKDSPVFLGYFDKKGKAIKKVYFYNYRYLAALNFPAAITQITFENSKDSIVTKTTYSNFKLDKEVSDEYFNFKIPPGAKVVFK